MKKRLDKCERQRTKIRELKAEVALLKEQNRRLNREICLDDVMLKIDDRLLRKQLGDCELCD